MVLDAAFGHADFQAGIAADATKGVMTKRLVWAYQIVSTP